MEIYSLITVNYIYFSKWCLQDTSMVRLSLKLPLLEGPFRLLSINVLHRDYTCDTISILKYQFVIVSI